MGQITRPTYSLYAMLVIRLRQHQRAHTGFKLASYRVGRVNPRAALEIRTCGPHKFYIPRIKIMARIANPREIQALKGDVAHNPQRYKGEVPKSEMAMGQAPEHMSDEARSVWFEIESIMVAGISTAPDRPMMELLCNLLAEYRECPKEFAIGKYGHLISCLARFGMSPSDRGRLAIEKPKDEDSFEML